MRAILTILLLGAGVLLASGTGRDQPPQQAATNVPALRDPTFSITSAPDRVVVEATTVSASHEDTLARLVGDQFPGAAADLRFRPGLLPGPGWEPTTARLVYVAAAMQSANARMRPGGIDIRGVTADADALSGRLDLLQRNLPDGVELTTDVLVVTTRATLDELCERAFRNLELAPVSFHESSAEIRPASLATLDRITDFARDCTSVTITITGHTDGSGDETWNRQLSLERARAVAAHIAANGIDPDRLVTRGLGSSLPVARNDTARGRERNRRIEFELE